MMFALLKVVEVLSQPSFLLLLIGVAGLACVLWRGQSAWGRRLLCAGLGGLLACAVLPVGALLMRPLEDRFPRPSPMPSHIDGIVVLGGAIALEESASRGMPALNIRAARMTQFVALARRYPRARLLFTGGSANIFPGSLTEADVARTFFSDIGLSSARVIFERRSRDTHENALYSRRLVHPKPGERWLLVTSAVDMPRAVGCFRAVGWPVIAFPADYHTTPDGIAPGVDLPGGLSATDWAVHEWIGLLYYRLRGWTPSLFPGPQP